MNRLLIVLCLGAGLALAACGKRGNLEHPEDVKPTWPRTYPAQ